MKETFLYKQLQQTLGEIYKLDEEMPGVFYVAAQGKPESNFVSEYYVVLEEANEISIQAKAYGKQRPEAPGILMYSMEEHYSGWRIIRYEILQYLVKNGMPIQGNDTPHNAAIFGRELHPDYFGAYPVPWKTPWGFTSRYQTLDNGIYWIETSSGKQVLCVCYPICNDFSYSAAELAICTNSEDPEDDYKCLMFSEHAACVAIFELLCTRNYWETSGLIDRTALMNAILTEQFQYSCIFNAQIQAGAGDLLGQLLKAFDADIDIQIDVNQMISFSPNTGTDYLHLEKI